ncbi:hypothetical protein E0Z10_g3961 [Xylaria hypoxylon]|uniref:Uncharacterized protein n=1 Tax=Xylaria hypoxylon TaxID=37992 RepID=A0A4Z0YZ94_9PEZI|nr:hypothetical protein E0Z10_g3961 [Xylaria hypoxylon]
MRLIDAKKVVNEFKIEFKTPLDEENEDIESNEVSEDNGHEGGNNIGNDSKPKYAILSHTWGWQDEKTGKWAHKVDEVTYDERRNFSNPFDESLHPDKQIAYKKIYYACRRALDRGCNYVWIDSCCIDKSNSAELTESINSMFRWYSEADVCLVYLVDSCGQATIPKMDYTDPCPRLYTKNSTPCRWFSRCWTLQELLASKKSEFYDSEWDLIYTLQNHPGPFNGAVEKMISDITNVDIRALLGRVPLHNYSVEAKMSWAASRKSARPEDIAYSLLGIFDIYMPLIYGEGAARAFQRLQLEIMKLTPDLSLFAWHTGEAQLEEQLCNALADSPSQFRFRRRICRSIAGSHYNMTNKGIRMTSVIHRVKKSGGERYFLCLEDQQGSSHAIGIFLRKIGYNVFQRIGGSLAQIENLRQHPSTHRSSFYITSSQQHIPTPRKPNAKSIHVPLEYHVIDVVPEACWDCENRVLMGNIPCSDGARALKLAIRFSEGLFHMTLIFGSSIVKVFENSTDTIVSHKIFTRAHRREFMNYGDLVTKIPEIGSQGISFGIAETLRLSVTASRQNRPHFQFLVKFVRSPEISKVGSMLELSVDATGLGDGSMNNSQVTTDEILPSTETDDYEWAGVSALLESALEDTSSEIDLSLPTSIDETGSYDIWPWAVLQDPH